MLSYFRCVVPRVFQDRVTGVEIVFVVFVGSGLRGLDLVDSAGRNMQVPCDLR